jgi:N-acetylmuramoyl-L-alanine amidase
MSRLLLWAFGLALLSSFEPAQAGQADPCGTAFGPGLRDPGQLLVLSDGVSLELRPVGPSRVCGPVLPGELHLIGNLVPGLLDPDGRVELLSRIPRKASKPMLKKRRLLEDRLIVVIDPGHGGHEMGCTGVVGTREKELVLAISRRLQKTLEELPDVQVIMTRASDEHISLWDRVDLANQLRADLFISVHANAFVRPSLGGVETFFHSLEASDEEARRVAQAENAPSRAAGDRPVDAVQSILADMRRAETLRDSSRFAHIVQAQLAQVLPFDNLGVKQADFVVLRGTHMPSVLLELGFLTNRREEKELRRKKTQEQVAQAVRLAVVNYRHLMLRKQVRPVAGEASSR